MKRFFAPLIVFSLCLPLRSCLAAPLEETLAQVNKLTAADKLDEAQQFLEAERAKATPEDRVKIDDFIAQLNYGWGETLFKASKFEEAIAHYQKAYEINKVVKRDRAAEAQAQMGAALRKLARYDEAVQACKLAIQIMQETKARANEAVTTANLGLTYKDMGRDNDALACCQLSVSMFQRTQK